MLKKYLKKNGQWLVLIFILVFGVIVRTKNFNSLPIDAHPMRQTDTECVAYFLYSGKSTFLKPKACLMRPVSNINGYFFLEVPFYEKLISISYKIFGPKLWAARLVNLVLYVIGSLSLFGLLKKWMDNLSGLLGVLIFGFVPGSIFFVGHALHPDVMAVSLIWLSLYLMWRYKETGLINYFLISGLSLGVSVASRPFGIICLPLLGYFLYLRKSKLWNYFWLLILSLLFYGSWYGWTKFLKVDMSWENWVLFGREKIFDLGILKNLIWKNIIGETMGKVTSGLAGLGLMVATIKKDKKIIPLIMWIFGVIIYWLIVPNGNLTHQYYADVYIPLVVILAVIGASFIWKKSKIVAIFILLTLIYNGVRTSNYHFLTNVEAKIDTLIAEEISREIGEDKKIIYLNRSNSVPLSLSHRQGWMLGEWPTDVAGHVWSFMEMRHYRFDYVVEPKHKSDLKTEEWDVIKENYPLEKTGEYINIYKYR